MWLFVVCCSFASCSPSRLPALALALPGSPKRGSSSLAGQKERSPVDSPFDLPPGKDAHASLLLASLPDWVVGIVQVRTTRRWTRRPEDKAAGGGRIFNSLFFFSSPAALDSLLNGLCHHGSKD